MKKMLLIVAAALGLWACASVPGQVKVTGGTIQGLVLDDMTVYKGIPFAAPPVGELRWKAPQPVVAWDGVQGGFSCFHPAYLNSSWTNSCRDLRQGCHS